MEVGKWREQDAVALRTASVAIDAVHSSPHPTWTVRQNQGAITCLGYRNDMINKTHTEKRAIAEAELAPSGTPGAARGVPGEDDN